MKQRINAPKSKLKSILLAINPHSKMNYEELKMALGLEDYFYETILLPIATEQGFKISFNGRYIHFDKEECDSK